MLELLLSLPALEALVGVLLLAAIWRAVRPSSVPSVPGPFITRFTNLWYAYRIYRGEFEKDNLELHRKYGPIVRYGVDRFSISSPLAAGLIYGPGSKFAKSDWYQTWSSPSPDAWSIFSDQDAKRHAANRRQYQNTYSMSSLVHYESYVDECADLFCQRMSEMTAGNIAGRPVDMGHWLQCYAFDVIGLITYSKRIGFLDLGQDISDVMRNLSDHLTYASVVGVYPRLHRPLFALRNWLAGASGKGRQFIIAFTQARMAAHQAQPKAHAIHPTDPEESDPKTGETLDFLTKFMRKHFASPETFTSYHALAGCVSNMVAGSDTTSISLSAVVYHVLRTPGVWGRLRAEVDQVCPREAGRNITFAKSLEMTYLQAVVKEALRVHPATGLPLERVVPEGGVTVGGVFFPEGATVGINSWVEHSNKSIFGGDADVFNPDRWLTADKERLSAMNRHWMPVSNLTSASISRFPDRG
ncbi:cytochrome P450 [Staphylotrichum tortipilum]|uniref:Cytochrome P450 n=1 Tax=Staphylotrichum tortipilum TaxID=2831512 RepID=A0AAN6RUC8_9PEZI|nr:cytochrome P450 [Staphylotrichum longicolle]